MFKKESLLFQLQLTQAALRRSFTGKEKQDGEPDSQSSTTVPLLKQNGNKKKPSPNTNTKSNQQLSTTHITRPRSVLALIAFITAMAAFVGALLGAYWLTLYFHYLPIRHDDCPGASEWKYPWCAANLLHGRELPPPLTPEQWLILRQKYVDAVGGEEQSTLAKGWDQLYKNLPTDITNNYVDDSINPSIQVHNHGFLVHAEIKASPTKGRGIFATKDILKGTKVWDSRYRGVFPDECSARTFFNSLTNQEACDAMFWGYVNNFYGNYDHDHAHNGIQYMLDLDGHGYLNHGTEADGDRNAIHHFEGEMETDNYALKRHFFTVGSGAGGVVGVGSAQLSPQKHKRRNEPGAYGLYASRDIKAGEEICYDYSEIFQVDIFHWYSRVISHSLPIHEWWTI